MGFFSLTQDIAMDLGTANTIITSNGRIVVDEPSVVAMDKNSNKMIAVGTKAKMMYEKTHDNIRTCRPLRDGVIADFNACELMMRGLIKMANSGRHLFTPSLRMVIGPKWNCVPSVTVQSIQEDVTYSLSTNQWLLPSVVASTSRLQRATWL